MPKQNGPSGPKRGDRPLLADPAEMQEISNSVLDLSPADTTEIVWIEVERTRACLRIPDGDSFRRIERSASVRVVEAGRPGLYRIDRGDRGALLDATRQALARARLAEPKNYPPLPGKKNSQPDPGSTKFDQLLANLTREEGLERLRKATKVDEAAILEWTQAVVFVANSNGLRRHCLTTCVTLQVRSGSGPEAGFFSQSGRSLEQLNIEGAVARARRRRASSISSDPVPQGPIPIALSHEATAHLADQLNFFALAGEAYRDGSSFLREHMNVQVFDRRVNLRDDGTDPKGLPFPFDLEGRSKRRVEVISKGVPKTPMLDTWGSFGLGLPSTGHCISPEESFGLNLFMEPGEMSDEELLRTAEGGLWIGRLENLEVYDPGRMRFRTRCRGVRKVTGGQIGPALPEVLWEDSILRVFSSFLGIGSDVVVQANKDGYLGGTSAPPIVVADVSGLAALEDGTAG